MGFYYKMVPDGTYCLTGYEGKDEQITFPSNITISILGDKLFKGHTEITKVEIPDSVTQIGGFVFDGCSNLKTLKLPPHLDDMWQYALTRISVEEIIIPGSLKEIIPFTFNEAKSLKTVTIEEGCKKIDAWAFKNCTALETVYLPTTMMDVHDKAFEGCGNVELIKKTTV